MKKNIAQATYIWIDGHKPSQKLRSKSRFLPVKKAPLKLADIPEWGYDGSSTYQAKGHFSDLVLKPVRTYPDPILGGDNLLVLCEVYSPDDTPHESNHRAELRTVMDNGGNEHDIWLGFEQEYTLMQDNYPFGWPKGGFPCPQGPYYCGVGAEDVFGRPLTEEHAQACLDANIMIFGTNAEVMPGQWEFQIGYRDIEGESADPLRVSDDLWVARWLLYRLGEDHGIDATLHPKPVKGDWNGAGKHTNFSSKETRDPKTGLEAINKAIEHLAANHEEHVKYYGAGLEERLTGEHETASISSFTSGESDRSASVRIPLGVARKGYGYLEDRRPGANACPYVVSRLLIKTIFQIPDSDEGGDSVIVY